MEGEELYQTLESSSHFRPPLNSVQSFFTPQNCFFIPPYQNSNTITIPNPPPPLVHRNVVAESIQALMRENLNFISAEQRKKQKKKKKRSYESSNPKPTWYKGPWTKAEDRKLCRLVLHYGRGQWATVAAHMNNGRIGKQCRERYHNNLFPNIKKSSVWSDEEEMMIIEGHKKFGNRWSAIAKFLPGRSENSVKNHWNSIKRRQLSSKNISRPHTHQSNLLEDYIRDKFFTSAAAAAAAYPPPFTITPYSAATNWPLEFTVTTAARFGGNEALAPVFSAAASLQPSFSYAVGGNSDALIPSFSAAATFALPPIAGSYNNLIPTLSTAAAFSPPPITGKYDALLFPSLSTAVASAAFFPPPITENYDSLFPSFSTTAAATATFSPPFSIITENSNAPMKAFCSAAAGATYTPPIMAVSESYDALIPTSFPTTFTTPPPATENNANSTSAAAAATFAPPPLPTTTENSVLTERDPPLSVDDYDTDGIPYFTFESAIDGSSELAPPHFTSESDTDESSELAPPHLTSESAIDENLDLMLPYFTSENAIDENLDSMQNMQYDNFGDNFTGNGAIYPSPFTGDVYSAASTPHFAAETAVDEEVGFLSSLFGSYGDMLWSFN